jgi:ABC-2 type transport system permease protein
VKTVAKLTWVEIKLFMREPIAVVFAFAFPLVVLLVLAGVFKNDTFRGVSGIDYYVPGYLAVVIASIGLIGIPVHLAALRERGVLRRLRASSVRVTSVFGAQAIVNFAMAVIGACVVVVAAALFYDFDAPSSVLGVAGAFAISTLSFVALGLLIGSIAPTARAAQAIGLVLFFPMWLLSGAGPPRGVMTETMRRVSDVLPLSRVVTAIQDPWLGVGSNGSDLIVLSIILILGIAMAVWFTTKDESGFAIRRRART